MIHLLALVFAICGLIAMVLGLDCNCDLIIWQTDYGSGCYTGDIIFSQDLFDEPESCQYVNQEANGTNYSFWFNISQCVEYEVFEVDIYNLSTDSSSPGCASNELWITAKIANSECWVVQNPFNLKQEFAAYFDCDED